MKFIVTLAADVRAYCTLEIEAADEAAATARGEEIARAHNGDDDASPEAKAIALDTTFDPEYSTLGECEVIDVMEKE